jgi:hypothetical protein
LPSRAEKMASDQRVSKWGGLDSNRDRRIMS